MYSEETPGDKPSCFRGDLTKKNMQYKHTDKSSPHQNHPYPPHTNHSLLDNKQLVYQTKKYISNQLQLLASKLYGQFYRKQSVLTAGGCALSLSFSDC